MKTKETGITLVALVIVLMIIVSGVSVYATSQYYATEIGYKDGKSVADALNELYEKQVEFDIDDDVIHGGDATLVSSITGFEVGKLYIIYIRHNSDNIPTMSDVEFIMPMRKFEHINTDLINYKHIYIGIVKVKSRTINLSEDTVISAKKLNY